MSEAKFALSWNEYNKNICNGLSSLQQNGEFVDMTLAADGHFVKVHQVIVALASPFIKQLISSANCPHPIVFLNKISYGTLSSVLEYIYTGEVLVSIENLDEFVEAGRELHIKGLEDMKLHQSLPHVQHQYQSTQNTVMEDLDEQVCYFEVSNQRNDDDQSELNYESSTILNNSKTVNVLVEDITYGHETIEEEPDNYQMAITEGISLDQSTDSLKTIDAKTIDAKSGRVMQYTVSNQGSLQMILNRFVYYLKHTNRDLTRQWRCVDYVSQLRCPALVVTKEDIVIQRVSAHTHPFHDKKILKKVKAGAIFSAIQEAEMEGTCKRRKVDVEDKCVEIDTE